MVNPGKAPTVVFSAGESSGDRHAAHMFDDMRKLQPAIRGLGMGGAAMRAAGIDIRFDSSGIGVIGLVEILKHYGEIRQALRMMKALVEHEKPDLLVCVDYKEFNLKLAQFAKRRGVKVLFYVSPQVWAWRSGRVKTYGQAIDMMAVIFPFETVYYQAENVPVRYVGHPSVDKVQPMRTRTDDMMLFGLTDDAPVVGLLPGSRSNEIKRMLPVMLDAVQQLAQKHPDCQFLLPQADSIDDLALADYLAACKVAIKVIKQQTYDAIQCCDAIMTTSGTASLEIALLGVPMVIAYRLSPLTYWLGKQLVKIPFIGLPNIIAGRRVVTELIQHDANADNLATEIERLLFDQNIRATAIAELQRVKSLMGEGGGSHNMALLALEMLETAPR
ncbi:MAG: lipid-A-disaccharide synthase [Methylomonas sp.]|nr:lipid-A-disaccharide synthase [Methylomonas sp.]PPD22632.1 MAG: lipid-A-disaccharide synthase [Methylomonas sp.]PPD27944.1 MAG: lipid-A-disaccharide synthase [Methylomonas sp.]PPD40053.1 MAG: lipid-A-disaccharide synthase [Methylomonas sp.]PPD41559.1 MAG: lipid-A-disaccharide synthase [Methylomonas sp.]